ncbi:MAG: DNA repair protein RadA [Actinomycetota bacterium]|nr:DNA repair protein RadA [Actinomycetota bacterium]
MECGYVPPRWLGRCPECQSWGSVEQAGSGAGFRASTVAGPVSTAATPVTALSILPAAAAPTGVGELDRVLGGGLVPGVVVLLAGEPGVGKSTLLLEVARQWTADGKGRALVVSGEESVGQIRLRAERIGARHDELFLAAESELAAALGHIEAVDPTLLIIDSVQTIRCAATEGSDGGVSQVRTVASALAAVAKRRNLPTILVGHVTKDGSIAGPRTLEHLVDVVLSFDGERHSALRLLRATKNRFGNAEEVGCFALEETGIVGVPDPSAMFVSSHRAQVAGTCLTVAMEGTRPLVAEVQALVNETSGPARRAVSGLDSARVALVQAVVERHAGLRLSDRDLFAATVGGVRITEPAADLAIALAMASAQLDKALPGRVIAIGEVGLSGELRRVRGLSRRIAEAARLGYQMILVPPDSVTAPGGAGAVAARSSGDLQVREAATLGAALAALLD